MQPFISRDVLADSDLNADGDWYIVTVGPGFPVSSFPRDLCPVR